MSLGVLNPQNICLAVSHEVSTKRLCEVKHNNLLQRSFEWRKNKGLERVREITRGAGDEGKGKKERSSFVALLIVPHVPFFLPISNFSLQFLRGSHSSPPPPRPLWTWLTVTPIFRRLTNLRMLIMTEKSEIAVKLITQCSIRFPFLLQFCRSIKLQMKWKTIQANSTSRSWFLTDIITVTMNNTQNCKFCNRKLRLQSIAWFSSKICNSGRLLASGPFLDSREEIALK